MTLADVLEKVHLYFHSRFRNPNDRGAEVTWNSGIDGTMTYLDKLHDDLFREVRELPQNVDLLVLVNRFQDTFSDVVRSLLRRGMANGFTDGYTIFPRLHVPLPNRHSPRRPRARIRGLTLTTKGFRRAKAIYASRYKVQS